jgi:hypothetical protein
MKHIGLRGCSSESFSDKRKNLFQIYAVGIVEGGKILAVDIEDGRDRSRLIEQGNDNLGT